jgi:hypothetical protein
MFPAPASRDAEAKRSAVSIGGQLHRLEKMKNQAKRLIKERLSGAGREKCTEGIFTPTVESK